MNDPEIKRKKTFNVRLTKHELIHLRDLFAVMLPPEMKDTLSQRLALSQGRTLVEAQLWQKLARACGEAELPLDDDAPDFVISTAGVPPITVFEVSNDPSDRGDRPSRREDGVFAGLTNDSEIDGQ